MNHLFKKILLNPNKVDWMWEPQNNLANAGKMLTAFEKWTINKSLRTMTLGGGYCYNHVTPHDRNTHSFSKVQTQDSGSAQGRSIIKQAPNKHWNDLLLRQRNNKSSRQAQTPKEQEVQRLREGRVWSENC
jgi:hypothetical protein